MAQLLYRIREAAADLRHPCPQARPRPAQPVWDEVERADVVLHAGDWVDVSLLSALGERAPR